MIQIEHDSGTPSILLEYVEKFALLPSLFCFPSYSPPRVVDAVYSGGGLTPELSRAAKRRRLE